MIEHNFSGRYSYILEELLEELNAVKVLSEKFEDDYQGFIDVDILLEDGRVFSYYYSYGSCFGCDDWENRELSDSQIKEEMLNEATIFDNIEQYNKWIENKRSKI